MKACRFLVSITIFAIFQRDFFSLRNFLLFQPAEINYRCRRVLSQSMLRSKTFLALFSLWSFAVFMHTNPKSLEHFLWFRLGKETRRGFAHWNAQNRIIQILLTTIERPGYNDPQIDGDFFRTEKIFGLKRIYEHVASRLSLMQTAM